VVVAAWVEWAAWEEWAAAISIWTDRFTLHLRYGAHEGGIAMHIAVPFSFEPRGVSSPAVPTRTPCCRR
jgi:hypothetical protein